MLAWPNCGWGRPVRHRAAPPCHHGCRQACPVLLCLNPHHHSTWLIEGNPAVVTLPLGTSLVNIVPYPALADRWG